MHAEEAAKQAAEKGILGFFYFATPMHYEA
jgi:hypothetical protein